MKKLIFMLLTLTVLLSLCLNSVDASWTQHGVDWNFTGACDVVVRNFGGEQFPDVAGLNTSGIVNVYENNGSPAFTTHFAAQVNSNCRLLRAGDLDNDGDVELVAASDGVAATGGIYLLWNEGNWQFRVTQIVSGYNHFDDLVVLDLDNDGDLDLAGIHDIVFWEHLTWWENTENGDRFIEHQLIGCDSKELGYADLDEDGDIDFTICNDGDILWLENTGNQMFVRHTVAANPTAHSINEVKPGDLNGDGYLDLLFGTYDGVFCYFNDGNLNFPRLEEIPSAISIHQIQVMEVDGDGWNDIVCYSGTWGYVRWIENYMCRYYDDWTLSQPTVGTVKYDTCDFNGDGRIDFAVTGTMTANNIQWYENGLNPTVKLQVFPQNTPIIIPPEGGSFDFSLTLWNTTSDTLIYNIWTSVAPEYGPGHPVEPVLLFENFPIMPDTVFSRQLTQHVPAGVPEDEYYYEVKVGDCPHFIDEHKGFSFYVYPEDARLSGAAADLADSGMNDAVKDFKLSASPNPFNQQTVISFELRAASQLELKIFDVTGREVRVLRATLLQAGKHEVVWDAKGQASGVYFVRLDVLSTAESRQHTSVRKVLLVK